jgi:hypothetical protein
MHYLIIYSLCLLIYAYSDTEDDQCTVFVNLIINRYKYDMVEHTGSELNRVVKEKVKLFIIRLTKIIN